VVEQTVAASQKRKSDQQWRTEHPDYFRDTYALQKEMYGTRSDYKRRYPQQHPDYVQASENVASS
jgi:hypothetical protein